MLTPEEFDAARRNDGTGKSGLTPRRAAELAAKAFEGRPSARQIIVIETRPTR